MTSPMSHGRPRRLKTIGPRRMTQKRTKNSNAGPSGEWISAATTSTLREDQGHVLEARTEPARGQPADGAVRLQRADRGVDDLEVRRPVRQDGRQDLAAAELPEHMEPQGLAPREAEGDGKVEEERVGPARAKRRECIRAVLDDERRMGRPDRALHDRR